MAFFLGDRDNPVVWRGLLKHSAISQFLGEVEWGELDVLVVALHPVQAMNHSVGTEVIENPYFSNHQPGVVPQFIHSQKANVMIAGGMGPRTIDFFNQFGIDVATDVQGKVRAVVDEYLRAVIEGVVAWEHHDHHGCEAMKIAISATGKNLDSQIDPRFGRCQYFIFVGPETLEFESVDNEGGMASGGAGVQTAQRVAQSGASALITGNLGPNAASALSASGVKVCLAPGGTVREAIEAYKSGGLREATGATVVRHSGMEGGCGMGGSRNS